jgi:hypothetical protein
MVGLLVLILFLFIAFKNYYKSRKVKETVILIGLLTMLSFNPASVITLIAFWWIIGFSFFPDKL